MISKKIVLPPQAREPSKSSHFTMSSSLAGRCFHMAEVCKSCQWEVLIGKQLMHACAKGVVMAPGLKLREDANGTETTSYMLSFWILFQKFYTSVKTLKVNQPNSTTGLVSTAMTKYLREIHKGQMICFGSWFQNIICLLVYLPRWDRALWWGECGRVMWLISHWVKKRGGERGRKREKIVPQWTAPRKPPLFS